MYCTVPRHHAASLLACSSVASVSAHTRTFLTCDRARGQKSKKVFICMETLATQASSSELISHKHGAQAGVCLCFSYDPLHS